MPSQQPVFVAEYVERRSRLTTFFRLILAIPHEIVLALWGFVTTFVVIFAWFAIVITGRYPRGAYDFTAAFIRYATAVMGYVYLLTDRYPPFGGDTDDYPVRVGLPEPLPAYDRLKTGFRFILAIPVAIIMYAMQIVYHLGSILAWFVIVITGKQPKGLQDMIVLGVSYQQRAYPYLALLTESWPSFTDTTGGSLDAGASDGPWAPERSL